MDPQVLESGRPGHFGLRGMRERAERVGGQLAIWSRPGAGTEIEFVIPGSVAYRAPGAGRFQLPGWRWLRGWRREGYVADRSHHTGSGSE